MNERAIREALGEEPLAGCMVMSKGYGTRVGVAAGIGGVLGVLAARLLARGRRATESPSGHLGYLYVAVGPTQVAFFEMKRGAFRNSLGRLLEKAPRSEITGCTFAPRMIRSSRLTITLRSGAVYQLDAARVFRGKAQKVHALLAAESG